MPRHAGHPIDKPQTAIPKIDIRPRPSIKIFTSLFDQHNGNLGSGSCLYAVFISVSWAVSDHQR